MGRCCGTAGAGSACATGTAARCCALNGRSGLGISLTIGRHEDDFTFAVSVPGVGLYLSGEGVFPASWRRRLPDDPHRTGIDWHHGGLWWNVWQNDFESRSTDPKWRRGHFDPMDFLFGRDVYAQRPLKTVPVEVPMPEKAYPATVTLFESTWTRRRWPHWPLTRRMVRSEIDVPEGVPHPGKGENSWDCGEDATYSLTCAETTVDGAVAALVRSVLRDRRKYGGANWRPAAKVAA
jgi:hypothetical protein